MVRPLVQALNFGPAENAWEDPHLLLHLSGLSYLLSATEAEGRVPERLPGS